VADDPPSFARAFPDDPALAALVAAFARGDYACVRREAPKLVEGAGSDEVRAAAARVLDRTRPDRLSILFFALAGLLLAFLSAYWWWKAGGAG